MECKQNITGMKFGRLTAVGIIKGNRWLCKCDCGKEVNVMLCNLLTGHTRGCGCKNVRRATRQAWTTKLYRTYHGMIGRCNNQKHPSYKHYGGRGIKVCERWMGVGGFDNFLADMGDRPKGLTLDRKNNDGDYSPENCHWATWKEQRENQRPGIGEYRRIRYT